jgi:hypothetical protein
MEIQEYLKVRNPAAAGAAIQDARSSYVILGVFHCAQDRE